MHKIGAVGDKDSILGLKALGISACPVTEGRKAGEMLKRLIEEGYVLIFITEALAKENLSTLRQYYASKTPAIVPIPGRQGVLGVGRGGIKKAVERAVGVDILFRD